jgi:hypothetical protein
MRRLGRADHRTRRGHGHAGGHGGCGGQADQGKEEEKEAHHVKAVDVEPSVLFAETEEPGLLECTSHQVQVEAN